MIVNIAFWIFVLAMDLLIPGVMIGFGKAFMKNPPREINPGFGYRTPRSSKNQDTWDFAQREMGVVWYKWGKILLIPPSCPCSWCWGGVWQRWALWERQSASGS